MRMIVMMTKYCFEKTARMVENEAEGERIGFRF